MERIILAQRITVAADASGRVTFCPPTAAERWKLKSIAYAPNATSAAHDTNYAAITPKKGSTALAAARETTTAGGALTVNVPENVTLTATGTDLEITQAAPMHVLVDAATNGTGVAVDLTVIAVFEAERV